MCKHAIKILIRLIIVNLWRFNAVQRELRETSAPFVGFLLRGLNRQTTASITNRNNAHHVSNNRRDDFTLPYIPEETVACCRKIPVLA